MTEHDDFTVDEKNYRHERPWGWVREFFPGFSGDGLFCYNRPMKGREHAVRAYLIGYKSGLVMGATQKQNEVKKVLGI